MDNKRLLVFQQSFFILYASLTLPEQFTYHMIHLIPVLIECYYKESYNKKEKDHYMFTLLMLLMKNNQYPEFMNSSSCKKLYGQEEGQYAAYLAYNKANEDLIIQRATNFYNGLHTK